MEILAKIKLPPKIEEKKETQHINKMCVKNQPVYFSNILYENFSIDINEKKICFESGVTYTNDEIQKIQILTTEEKISIHNIKSMFGGEIVKIENPQRFNDFMQDVKNLIQGDI